ncbi:hypothetical protein [Cohnella sp. JJ-181]|uniref:hypothetical protein n=1 Tax=Cohnella rhizoplanae TaxID=2974897 RepID=UPI0022FF797A|nr:hypothetical protein [Cohnella sp. JJ-181]CAI6085991.1 hypothetical protein COHCIP112018_04864 [Cohnella sp. JJ-181]
MAIRFNALNGSARLPRVAPVYRVTPPLPFQDVLDEETYRYVQEEEGSRRAPAPAPLPPHMKRAAAAASSVVQQAIEVNYAVDKVYASPSEAAMTELQDKADSLIRRLQSEQELQLDPDLGQRLSGAYSPMGLRRVAEPLTEQAPWRMIPIREAIYTDQMQIQSLYPETGLVLSAEA